MAQIILDNEPHFTRLQVIGRASQTQNLLECYDTPDNTTPVFSIGPAGSVGLPSSTLTAAGAASTPLTITGNSGQTADLFDVKDGTGTVRVLVGDLTNVASPTLRLIAIPGQTGPILSLRDSGNANSDFRIFPSLSGSWSARLFWRFGSAITEQDSAGSFGGSTRLFIAPNGDQLDILNEAASTATASFKTTTGLALTATDAATTTTTQPLTIAHATSGTPAAGFGGGIQVQLQSTTTAGRAALDLNSTWVVATDASRTSRTVLSVYDTAAREVLRGEASGTAPMIGFLGAAAVVRQTLAAAAVDAATTQTLANSLRTALINLGLGA